MPESFFNKVAGLSLRPAALLKKETLAQVFSSEFCETSKNTYSYRTPPVATASVLKSGGYKIKSLTKELYISDEHFVKRGLCYIFHNLIIHDTLMQESSMNYPNMLTLFGKNCALRKLYFEKQAT